MRDGDRTRRTWPLGWAVLAAVTAGLPLMSGPSAGTARAADTEAADKPEKSDKPAKADTPAAAAAAKDQETRDKWFADLLTNADLVGQYTASDAKDAKEDRYTILKAVKGEGDKWVITAKIAYKGVGVPMDITVPVRWAGDTPMIQLTEEKVMGMGPFTVRLMFHGDQYAGMWSSPRHGGMMWGRIEHPDKAGAAAKPATKPAQ